MIRVWPFHRNTPAKPQEIVRSTKERNLPWSYARRAQLAGERRERFERAMGL